METQDIPVEEYDQDGTLVCSYVERVMRFVDPRDVKIADLERRVTAIANNAANINPGAATTVTGTQDQIETIKTALTSQA